MIGAPRDDDNGSASGSVYIFDATTGLQVAKLLPDDGLSGDEFGWSVAISGTTALVGARGDDDNGSRSGSVYLFDTITGQQTAKLLPNDGETNQEFGYSVAIDGTTAVVGAWLDDDNGINSGAAYVFDTTTSKQIFKLLPNDGASSDSFGRSVAISGSTALIGAYHDDDMGPSSGSAYLFDLNTGKQSVKLLPSDGTITGLFGWSVAISESTVVVGAHNNGGRYGSAYRFTTNSLCSPDLTNDGTLDFFDVSAFLTAFAASDPAADFNADGVFNFFDVSVFLTEYLAGCP